MVFQFRGVRKVPILIDISTYTHQHLHNWTSLEYYIPLEVQEKSHEAREKIEKS